MDKQQLALQLIDEGRNILVTGSAGCVDKDTEFLSPDGWVKISEYSGQEVAQISEYGLQMSFTKPLRYIKEPCSEFYAVSSERGIDQWLSDDHSIAYTVKDKLKLNKKSTLSVIDTANNNEGGFSGKIPCVFNYEGGSFSKNWSEAMIRVAVALKADGSLVTESTGRYRVNLKKKDKEKRLLELLQQTDLKYEYRQEGYDKNYCLFIIYFPECTKRLDQFWMVDKPTAEIVVDEIKYWDGSVDPRTGNPKYFTTNKSDADTCQLLGTMCGYKVNIATSDRRGRVKTDKITGKEYTTKTIDYTVNFSKQTHIGLMYRKNKDCKFSSELVKQPSKDGYKYCFTVETGFLLLRRKDKIFITGNCGKTYIMKQAINASTLVCAPTGIAALNIGGITCHRAFKLPIGLITDAEYKLDSKTRDILKTVKRIIIDEVGMLRSDILDLINWKCQRSKQNQLPFGGIQMILVGDFYQLEPIVSNREAEHFYDEYDTAFCFGANCFKDNFEVIELTKVYRQDNKRQVSMLNSIRKKDKWYRHAVKYIMEEAKGYTYDEDVLHLCCYKWDAKKINETWYDKLEGSERTYRAISDGMWKDNELPVEQEVKLKIGTKVIICANDLNDMYVNGDKGVVVGFSYQSVFVRKDNGQGVTVEYNKWEKYGYSNVDGTLSKGVEATYEQIPIKLGWAVTVHASQGLTLDNIAIHAGRGCFSHGQAYVALSRAKDLRNISFVKPLNKEDIIVKSDVINFYKGIGNESL